MHPMVLPIGLGHLLPSRRLGGMRRRLVVTLTAAAACWSRFPHHGSSPSFVGHPGWRGCRCHASTWRRCLVSLQASQEHGAPKAPASGSKSRGAPLGGMADVLRKVSSGSDTAAGTAGATAAKAAAAVAPAAAPTAGPAPSQPPAAGTAGGADPSSAKAATPEEVVQMLLALAPDATGAPPPDVVGEALRLAGVPVNRETVTRALKEAARLAVADDAVAAALAAGQAAPSAGRPTGAGGVAAPRTAVELAATLKAAAEEQRGAGGSRPPEPAASGARLDPVAASSGGMSPEQAVAFLLEAAGPGAGTPPPEVVGAALRAAGTPVDEETVLRALGAAAGPDAGPEATSPEAVAAALQAAGDAGGSRAAEPATSAVRPDRAAASSGGMSPEQAVAFLKQAAGPEAGTPPPEVVGAALRAAGTPVDEETVLRALRAAAGPDAGPEATSLQAVEAALQAAGAT